MRFTNKLISLILALLMITLYSSGIVVLADSVVSQPSVSGIYIDGTPAIGQTLTLNYTVNNPDGSLDGLSNNVKWYKQTNKYYLRNVDSDNDNAANLLQTGGLTFTIPNDESLVGKYISVTIPVASVEGNGRTRTMGVGPIGESKTSDMISSSVTIVPGNDNGVGGDCGDTLLGKFVEPNGTYSCQWYVSDEEDGTYAAIEGATDDEYVISDDLYGKYIKFGITLDNGTTLMSDNTVLAGNAAFGAFVYGSIYGYAGAALNSLTNGIELHEGGGIYTWGGLNSPDKFLTVDLGKQIEVSDVCAIFTSVGSNDYYQLSCSPTGEDGTWESMVTESPFADTENGIKMDKRTASLVRTYTARYIRIYHTASRNIIFSELAVISKGDKAPTLTLEGGDVVNILKGLQYEEPGYTAVDPEDGDITDEVIVTGTVNTDEIGEYTLTYSVTDHALRPHTVTATRTVKVSNGFQKDGDLAYNKDVTVSGGTNPEALVDGNTYTAWNTGVGESNAVIDLGVEEFVSKIEIEETGNSITSFKLYSSTDGEAYSLIASSNTGIGNYTKSIDVVKARYLKLVVNSVDGDGAINSFCCYLDESGASSMITQPSVAGIYIDGTPAIGQTLTLNYTINNPDGSLDGLSNKVKWHKQTNKYYVRSVDSDNDNAANLLQTGGLTYTIPNDESLVGKYISVTIPVASVEGNGRTRTMGVGPIYGTKDDDMISSSVTIVSGNDNGVGGDCGDKLLGSFVEPDGTYICQWYVSGTENGTYTAINGATNNEFVITNDLYGKYIKFGITLDNGTTLMSDNTVLAGNAAFGAFVYGNVGSQGCYGGCALNALTNGIYNNQGGGIYTYGGTTTLQHFVTVDLGRKVEVSDVIATFSSAADTDYFALDYSLTGADGTWERMVPQTPLADTDNGIKMTSKSASLSRTYTARYVRIYFTHSKNISFSELAVISKNDKEPTLTLNGGEVANVIVYQEYVEPGYTAVDPEDGDLTSEVIVTGSVNVNVLGEYTLTYSVTDLSVRSHTVTATRTVKVCDGFQRDGDLAYKKNVTVSGGTNREALVDGNEFTSWNLSAGETNAVIDLGSEELISKVEIEETGNSITDFKLYGSTDGSTYSLITSSDSGMGNYAEDIDVVKVRYLKLVVNSKDAAGAINTFCCYFDNLGKVKYAADKIKIDADLNNVTENLPLPDSGEFDTTIEWRSSSTSVVSNNGTVYRGTSDERVVLTAKVILGNSSVTRNFDVIVIKTSSGRGGGGNGGGGSSVSIPSNPIVVPKPLTPVDTSAKAAFTDLTEEHWAYEYIDYLYELKLISGFGDGTFGPNEYLTRAQYLKMVLESLALSEEGTVEFTDVNENDWYYKYVVSAVKLGIVNGMGDGTFGSDLPVSRQDMAVISARALDCAGLLPEFESTTVFTDYTDISGYAVEAVGRMNKAGIISGDSNGLFRPLSTATRAEASKIVYHLYKLKGGN